MQEKYHVSTVRDRYSSKTEAFVYYLTVWSLRKCKIYSFSIAITWWWWTVWKNQVQITLLRENSYSGYEKSIRGSRLHALKQSSSSRSDV